MSAAARIALYGAGLVVVFLGSAFTADALVPASWVAEWSSSTGGADPTAPAETHDEGH